ncbi:MAG: hypothetical protein SNH55_06050 [Rikenellaceae bacterium]
MKRLFLYLVALTSLLATSCSLFSSDETSDYGHVYKGIVMYSSVQATNNLAMDGVNVAMRLALLLNEMEDVGLEFDSTSDSEPDWSLLGNITYGGLPYNKKEFLFGNSNNAKISKDGDKYYIEYGYNGSHTAGAYDMEYRIGTYCVDTSGVTDILDSSSSSRWSVTISGEQMTFSASKNDAHAIYLCSGVNAQVWSTSDGEFAYSVSNLTALYRDESEDEDDWDYCDWSTEGTVSIPYYTAFTVGDTINTDFNLSVVDAGGVAVTLDIYAYNTSSPIIYNFLSGANLKYGGVENVEYMKSSTSLPSSTVLIETASNGLQTFYYNGYSYIYDDEYFYLYYIDSFREDEEDAEDDYLDALEDEEDDVV